MMHWIKKIIIHNKLYIIRSMSYMNVVNTLMILYLAISNYLQTNKDIKLSLWLMIPISILWVSFLIFFGKFEDRQGWFSEELKRAQSRSPYTIETMDRLDRIEKKLNSMERKLK